ncbi:MAG: hypothetical protein JNM74_02500 [Myxococcales bacterium]|nr:hypothetical protein [Myxococcales bacterium]
MKKALGIVALMGIVGMGFGIGCTVENVTADGGTDAATADATATATGDAAKPRTDGGGPASCYDEEGALALSGVAPTRAPGKCSDALITEFDQKCLGSAANGCEAFIDANKDCSRCLIGALQGDDEKTVPVPALLSISDDAVVPNTASCAALVIGRPDCALKLAIQETCLTSACAVCEDEATDTACRKEAEAGICKTVVDAACTQAIESRAAEWQALCSGADFDAVYPKVARVMCGGSPTDAGGGG